MEYEIVKLSLLSGVQCTVYSIVPEKGGMTLYDDFVKEKAEYREDVKDINNRLRLIFTFLKTRKNKHNTHNIMKAREYNSPLLQDLLEEVTPLEMEQTNVKMQLAANIEDLIRSKGWSKTRFATELNKSQPEISKWLSGTHNFTVETLVQISQVLGVEIAALFAKNQVKEVYSSTFSAASYQYITYSMKNYAVNENSVSYGDKPI